MKLLSLNLNTPFATALSLVLIVTLPFVFSLSAVYIIYGVTKDISISCEEFCKNYSQKPVHPKIYVEGLEEEKAGDEVVISAYKLTNESYINKTPFNESYIFDKNSKSFPKFQVKQLGEFHINTKKNNNLDEDINGRGMTINVQEDVDEVINFEAEIYSHSHGKHYKSTLLQEDNNIDPDISDDKEKLDFPMLKVETYTTYAYQKFENDLEVVEETIMYTPASSVKNKLKTKDIYSSNPQTTIKTNIELSTDLNVENSRNINTDKSNDDKTKYDRREENKSSDENNTIPEDSNIEASNISIKNN